MDNIKAFHKGAEKHMETTRTMTIREFNKSLSKWAINDIVFHYENQKVGLGLNLHFPSIYVFTSTNTVALEDDGGNTITFFEVKHVEVDAEKNEFGTIVVNLFCDRLGEEHIYSLLLKFR